MRKATLQEIKFILEFLIEKKTENKDVSHLRESVAYLEGQTNQPPSHDPMDIMEKWGYDCVETGNSPQEIMERLVIFHAKLLRRLA